MIIDGHAHACGSCNGTESVKRYLKEHKIDKVILCGGEPNSNKDYGYPMLSNIFTGEKLGYFFNKIISKVTHLHSLSQEIDRQNQLVYDISASLPEQVLNAYWINPAEENCLEKMKRFYETKGFTIIKMHQCWTAFNLDSENCRNIYRWAQENKIPVFIHIISRKQVEVFRDVANEFANTNFIIAHMIGADYLYDKLHKNNVYWDLSAPQLYSSITMKKILERYGAEKLLLGSDTPYGKNNIQSVMKRLNRLNLSKKDLDAITYKNIIELLHR